MNKMKVFGWVLLCLLTINLNLSADCPSGTAPTVKAFAMQASCDPTGNPLSDAYLQLSSVLNGDRISYSVGSTYTGSTDYAGATNIGALPFVFATGLSNPVGSQDYTIRVFNGASDCFTDVVLTMNEQDCVVGCSCDEYVYLNEPSGDLALTDAVHKFLVNPDGTFTEQGNPWFDNNAAGETVDFPHGVTIDGNGFVYVGEQAAGGDIRRFSCDGTIHPTSEFAITHNGQTNLAASGTTLYTNHWTGSGTPDYDGITSYDLCDGSYIGEVEFCDTQGSTSIDWGFHVDPYTGTMYSTNNFTPDGSANHIYIYDETDFDADPSTCVAPTILNGLPAANARIAGVTTDPSGNLYIVVNEDQNIAANPEFPSYIMKFGPAPNYPLLATTPYDFEDDGTGYYRAIGIIYSETTDKLYVSTRAFVDDCIVVLDTDLNPAGPGVPAPNNGAAGKGIAITKECCPLNNVQIVNSNVCNGAVGENFLLADLISCEGSICESEWAEAAGNTGISYNSCDNSITITDANPCGTFYLNSDGSGANVQCGAFAITLNLGMGNITDPVIAGDQTVCAGTVPAPLTIPTLASANGTVTYQWQSSTTSCDADFLYTDIPGATGTTYTPPATGAVGETVYYRVVASTVVGCSGGDCDVISNCVNITSIFCCPATSCGSINVVQN